MCGAELRPRSSLWPARHVLNAKAPAAKAETNECFMTLNSLLIGETLADEINLP